MEGEGEGVSSLCPLYLDCHYMNMHYPAKMLLNRQPRWPPVINKKKTITTSASSCKTNDVMNDRVLYTFNKIQKTAYGRIFFFILSSFSDIMHSAELRRLVIVVASLLIIFLFVSRVSLVPVIFDHLRAFLSLSVRIKATTEEKRETI